MAASHEENISKEDFAAYWLNEHAKLQKTYIEKLGVRAFIKNEPLLTHPIGIEAMEAYKTGPIRYDFIDTWQFNDIEALKSATSDPEVRALMQQAHESEIEYIFTIFLLSILPKRGKIWHI